MAKIAVERIFGNTKKAVLGGLLGYNSGTMSFQAPGVYRACGYEEFGSIDGYPEGVTRHWFTKAL